MPVDKPEPAKSDTPRPPRRIDIAAIEADSANATWGDRGGIPELLVKSPRVARFGAALLAVFAAIGTAWWAWVAFMLFRPQGVLCEGCAADWAQLILAGVGVAVAVLVIAYLTYFAITGRIWISELYIKSPRVARFGAALLFVFVAIGTYRWARVAYALFRPQGVVCEGCGADWYRWTQLILAVAGIVVAGVVMAYLAFFATSGRIWRRWLKVAMTFGILAATWTTLWWIVKLFPLGR